MQCNGYLNCPQSIRVCLPHLLKTSTYFASNTFLVHCQWTMVDVTTSEEEGGVNILFWTSLQKHTNGNWPQFFKGLFELNQMAIWPEVLKDLVFEHCIKWPFESYLSLIGFPQLLCRVILYWFQIKWTGDRPSFRSTSHWVSPVWIIFWI